MKKNISTIFLAFLVGIFSIQHTYGQTKNKKEITYKQKQIAEESFVMGAKFLMLENDPKALKSFKRTLLIEPKNAAVNHFVAQILQRQYKYDDALIYAEIAFENDDNNVYYYLSLANIFSKLGNNKDAAKIYEKILKKFPTTEEYFFNLAEIYSRMKKWSKSLEILDRFTEEYGFHEEVINYKQTILLRQNKFDEAIAEGDKLIKQDPKEVRYVVKQAQIFLSNNKKEEAKTLLQDYTTKYGEKSSVLLILSDISRSEKAFEKANEFYLKAFKSSSATFTKKLDLIALQTRKMYFSKLKNNLDNKNTDLTKTMCEEILKEFPKNAKAHTVNADFYALLDDKKQAQKHYINGLKLDGSEFKSWEQLVLLDAELEEYDSLVKHSTTALELFPNKGVIWYFNGSAHFMMKQYKQAVYSFEKAKKLSQSNIRLLGDINAQLGDAYHYNNQYLKSDKVYDEVLAVSPNNQHVLNNYSYYLSLRNEKLEKAFQMSKKTLDIRPNSTTYIDTHAWVLYKMKRYTEAKKLLIKIVDTSKSSEVIEHYGDVLFRLGETNEALIYWKKAKSFGEGSDFLDQKINEKKIYE